MFEIAQRTVNTLLHIHADRQNHKRKMQMMKKNEDHMLIAIDNVFATMK